MKLWGRSIAPRFDEFHCGRFAQTLAHQKRVITDSSPFDVADQLRVWRSMIERAWGKLGRRSLRVTLTGKLLELIKEISGGRALQSCFTGERCTI